MVQTIVESVTGVKVIDARMSDEKLIGGKTIGERAIDDVATGENAKTRGP